MLTLSEVRPDGLYTAREACDLLRACDRTLRRYMAAGLLTSRSPTARLLFLGADLLQLVGLRNPPPAPREETTAERKRRAQHAAEETRAIR